MASTTKRNKASPLIASLLDNDTWDAPKFGTLYQLWMERKRNPTLESAFRKSAPTNLPTAASLANKSVENAIQQDELTSPNQTNAGTITNKSTSLSILSTDDQSPTTTSVASKHTSIMFSQGSNYQLPTAASAANTSVENANQLDELTSPNQTNTGIVSLFDQGTDDQLPTAALVASRHTYILVQGSNNQLPTAASVANASLVNAT